MTTPRKVDDPEGEKHSALRFAGHMVEQYGEGDLRLGLAFRFAHESGAAPEEIADATGLSSAFVTEILDRMDDPVERAAVKARLSTVSATPRKTVDPEGDKRNVLRQAEWTIQHYGKGDRRVGVVARFASESGASPDEIVAATGLPPATVKDLLDPGRSHAG